MYNFDFWAMFLLLKGLQRKCVVFGAVLWSKEWYFGVCCQTNSAMQQKSGIVVGIFGCNSCKRHQLVLFTHYYDVLTLFKQEINHKSESGMYFPRIYAWMGCKGLRYD